MADLSELGDSPDRRCWPCGDRIPGQAKANDPNHPAADQVWPAVKGDRGRGVVRLAHKRCNGARGASSDRP